MQLNELKVKKLFNENYILLEDFRYQINRMCITIPKGFVTDFASIPKMLHLVIPKHGKYDIAAVVHDFLYSELNVTGINRKLADKIFYHIMKETEVNSNTRKKFYKAVRYFGAMSWQDKIENEGYKDQAIIDHTKEAREYYNYWNRILKI